MRLILEPAEDVAHGDFLRRTPGAYEWWYFDALSDDGLWAFVVIYFLGNPFSPYYRLASKQTPADPFAHNAVFFALYHAGNLYAYHFTRFPKSQVCADETRPATLGFGPNALGFSDGTYFLTLADENANRRQMTARLTFAPPAPKFGGSRGEGKGCLTPPNLGAGRPHFWLPAAPACRVSGVITLREKSNAGTENIAFAGSGYHDHNWGTLPFDADVRDWYWARADLGNGRAAILYHVEHENGGSTSHLLIFDDGHLAFHDDRAQVTKAGRRINAFGASYASCLEVRSGDISAQFFLGKRLDSAPFYLRTLAEATVTTAGVTESGRGVGEYFRPALMANPVVASAMKARIVER